MQESKIKVITTQESELKYISNAQVNFAYKGIKIEINYIPYKKLITGLDANEYFHNSNLRIYEDYLSFFELFFETILKSIDPLHLHFKITMESGVIEYKHDNTLGSMNQEKKLLKG